MKINFVSLILLSITLSGVASEEGFSRYQVIINKHPFGEDPPEVETVQISLSESFAKSLRLSMIFEGAGGDLRAGIIDSSNSKNYILKVGEIEDGIELVEVDINASEALLRKDNEVALFKLESDKPQLLSKKQQTSRRSSYAERRRALLGKIESRKKEQKKEPAKPKLTGEVLRQHLEGVQMDAIRNGLPPLPIPLTPEMDAQLVSEGVLEPQ